MLALAFAFATIALVQASPMAQAASAIPAPSSSLSSMSIPSVTLKMPIGEFPGFTQGVAPYLLASGTDSFTRSTTQLSGTNTASGLVNLYLPSAATNYLYTHSFTNTALTAVVQAGFTCSLGTTTTTSYGFFGTSLSASPTVALTPTPLVGTLAICQQTVITTGPSISRSAATSVTRLFVDAYHGTDGYFTPIPTTTSS